MVFDQIEDALNIKSSIRLTLRHTIGLTCLQELEVVQQLVALVP